MRVWCSGPSKFYNRYLVRTILDGLHSKRAITAIIQCNNNGAERQCRLWAHLNGVRVLTYLPLWDNLDESKEPVKIKERKYFKDGTPGDKRRFNSLAQFNCNTRVIAKAKPDFVVAFAGKGSGDVTTKARNALIRCAHIRGESCMEEVYRQLRRQLPDQSKMDLSLTVDFRNY